MGRVLKGAMIREILVESSQCYAHETRPRLCTLALFLVCSISLQLLCCSLPYIDRIWLLNFWLDITIKNVKGILEFFWWYIYIFLVYILPPKLALGFEFCMQICISNWLIDIKRTIWLANLSSSKNRNLSIAVLAVGLLTPNVSLFVSFNDMDF